MRSGIKKISFLLLLLFTGFAFTGSAVGFKRNPYGLPLVSTTRMYSNLIRLDPQKELVDLQKFIPRLVTDIRYATPDNFTGTIVYSQPGAFARRPVAEALLKIQEELNATGIGLKVYDAYRPYSATVRFFEICPDTGFCAPPWTGSKHNRGCAVDVSLIDLKTGRELEMPTGFDDFTPKASHKFMELPDRVLRNRQLLRDVMTRNGFLAYNDEWWHYNFRDWEKYELMDISFRELSEIRRPKK